jgi:methyl-accepting chemotaxis protein
MMNACVLSIRNVLFGVICLMSLVIIALMGQAAFHAYQRTAATRRIVAISLLDKALFEAVQHFRFERGTMALILSLPPGPNPREEAFALTNRRVVDAELGKVFPAIESLNIPGLRSAVNTLIADYADFRLLREQTDGMAKLPFESRDMAFKDTFMPRSSRLQTSIEAVSAMMESEMRQLDPATADLILVKTLAWEARTVVGTSILSFNSAIAGNRGLNAAELGADYKRLGRRAAYRRGSLGSTRTQDRIRRGTGGLLHRTLRRTLRQITEHSVEQPDPRDQPCRLA